MRLLAYFLFYFVLIISFNNKIHADDDSKLIETMKSGGHILMLRHAQAPGYGDPDNIKLGDCSTQRNLNDSGREQSTKIGKWLKDNNIKPSAIYSSQWCRCLETAKLLDLGSVEELTALNSFFQKPQDREPNLRDLRKFITQQTPDSDLIIMVTHSVTISAISGQSVASGDGVLLKLNNSDLYEFVGVVKTD